MFVRTGPSATRTFAKASAARGLELSLVAHAYAHRIGCNGAIAAPCAQRAQGNLATLKGTLKESLE
eukprot:2446904-Amphidinium_carterae.1